MQVVVLGFFVDSMLIRSGVIVLPNDVVIPPVWLICLWIVFSTLLNHSLRWLHSQLFFAVLLGALAAPFSYYAGIRLTDVSLAEPRGLVVGLRRCCLGRGFSHVFVAGTARCRAFQRINLSKLKAQRALIAWVGSLAIHSI